MAHSTGARGSSPLCVPDLSRPLFCLFGLIFDNVSMDEALDIVRDAVSTRRRCVISTPNLNFVVHASRDAAFRDIVLRSQLNLADGMPLVWAGRWIGVRIKGRVAGSNLFERLRGEGDPARPLGVYLFGGPPGAALSASERLNLTPGGVRCVGHHMPGYGSLADMSGPDMIEAINTSGADFVLVALGAEKGQAWIERNRTALVAPVISHLGATINYLAGSVRRAPAWMQETGLEWLWRIVQEPSLWRRYARDALAASRLVAWATMSAALAGLTRSQAAGAPEVVCSEGDTSVTVSLRGAFTASDLTPLRAALADHGATTKRLHLNLRSTTTVDSSAVALLLLIRRFRLDEGLPWSVSDTTFSLARRFDAFGAGELVRPSPPSSDVSVSARAGASPGGQMAGHGPP